MGPAYNVGHCKPLWVTSAIKQNLNYDMEQLTQLAETSILVKIEKGLCSKNKSVLDYVIILFFSRSRTNVQVADP